MPAWAASGSEACHRKTTAQAMMIAQTRTAGRPVGASSKSGMVNTPSLHSWGGQARRLAGPPSGSGEGYSRAPHRRTSGKEAATQHQAVASPPLAALVLRGYIVAMMQPTPSQIGRAPPESVAAPLDEAGAGPLYRLPPLRDAWYLALPGSRLTRGRMT